MTDEESNSALISRLDHVSGQLTTLEAAVRENREIVDRLTRNERGAKWRNRFILGTVVLLLLTIVLVMLAFRHQHNDDQAKNAQLRQGSCIQFNVNQQAGRNAIANGVSDAILKLYGTDPRGEQFANALRPALLDAAAKQLPYRDCSTAGINTYLKHPPADPNSSP